MTLFVLSLVAGAVLGYARGGRLRELKVPWLALPIIAVALGLQLVVSNVRIAGVLLAMSYALVGLLVAATAKRVLRDKPNTIMMTGLTLLAFGWALNTLVILANGGMPVSAAALKSAGSTHEVDVKELGPLQKHIPASDETRFFFLADVIPVPLVEGAVKGRKGGAVMSLGDIAFLAGIVAVVGGGMSPNRRLGTCVGESDQAASTR